MRSYGQQCALAKALDVIGDRWTLLIVRELLIREACRYTDLKSGLPGIATNLLADRLRDLEQAGIVYREEAPPPVATTLFRLTARGKDLEPVLDRLGQWGAPLLAQTAAGDAFCPHWLALPLKLYLRDGSPNLPPITIELRFGQETLTLETAAGKVRARPGRGSHPDAVLSGNPQLIMAVLTGKLSLAEARSRGAEYEGQPAVLSRVVPTGPLAKGGTHRVEEVRPSSHGRG